MGRIRSIHPDILTDPDFAEVHRDGRLLFVYSLIVADDAGNLEDSPRALKMACFPGDDDLPVARIEELRDALLSGRFYEPYEADGKRYLHVRNFAKYQKPDHPTKPKFPLFPGQSFTYHARQGNTYIPKTEQGPSPEPKANVPRTLSEREANVLAGEERSGTGTGTGEERIGRERNRKGGDRGGKPTKPDARPLALEGQSAPSSTKDKSNGGKASGKEELPEHVSSILQLMDDKTRRSVEGIYRDVKNGDQRPDSARSALVENGISSMQVECLFSEFPRVEKGAN